MIYPKGSFLRIFWGLAPLFLCVPLASCFSKKKSFSNATVLKINDTEISAKEFSDKLATQLKFFDSLSAKDKRLVDRAKQSVIRDYLVQALTEQWARKNNIFVRREELEKKVNDFRSSYPDDEAFRQALSEQGVSFETWKLEIKYSLLQEKVLQHLRESMKPPTEQELKTYYKNHKDDFHQKEQIQLSQIVLKKENDAKRIYESLKKGRKFEDLAKEFSVSPESHEGGLLGWVTKGTLEVFDQAFSQKPGQLYAPIQSPYGYHIMKVLKKRRAKTLPFSDAKAKISQLLLEKREQAAYAAWLEQQTRASKIFKDEKLIDSMDVHTQNR